MQHPLSWCSSCRQWCCTWSVGRCKRSATWRGLWRSFHTFQFSFAFNPWLSDTRRTLCFPVLCTCCKSCPAGKCLGHWTFVWLACSDLWYSAKAFTCGMHSAYFQVASWSFAWEGVAVVNCWIVHASVGSTTLSIHHNDRRCELSPPTPCFCSYNDVLHYHHLCIHYRMSGLHSRLTEDETLRASRRWPEWCWYVEVGDAKKALC